MVNIESDINAIIKDNEFDIKITNIELTNNDGYYYTLVTYEKNLK